MTVEDFYKEYPEFNYMGSPTSIFEKVLTDDFESRVCKNCNWYEDDNTCNHFDNEQCDITFLHRMQVTKNFGCNKFVKMPDKVSVKERKDEQD